MDLMEYRRRIIASSPHLSSAEGAVASFPDGTDLPLKSLIVNIDPVQSGSGDPSPTNIRPISGWDAVGVTRTGKNLLGGYTLGQAIVNAVSNTAYSNFVSDSTGDYVTIKASSYTSNKRFTDGVKFKNNTPYTVILRVTRNIVGPSVNSNISVVYTDGTSKTIYFAESTDTEIVTVAFVTDGTKTVKHIQTSWGGGTAKLYYNQCGIFEGTLSADGFEPYTGTSISIDLGRTVYGGTHNPLMGELVADMVIVDLGTLTWAYSNGFFRANPNPEYKRPSSQQSTINALCTIYKNTTWNDVGSGDKEYAFSSAVTRPEIIIKDSDYTNSAAFKTAMSGVMLVYELATPLTYHLDPQTVRSLVGNNNIFADTGNTSLDYWAHP